MRTVAVSLSMTFVMAALAPLLAPYDFNGPDDQPGIPFAVGVDGEPIRYDPALDPVLVPSSLQSISACRPGERRDP